MASLGAARLSGGAGWWRCWRRRPSAGRGRSGPPPALRRRPDPGRGADAARVPGGHRRVRQHPVGVRPGHVRHRRAGPRRRCCCTTPPPACWSRTCATKGENLAQEHANSSIALDRLAPGLRAQHPARDRTGCRSPAPSSAYGLAVPRPARCAARCRRTPARPRPFDAPAAAQRHRLRQGGQRLRHRLAPGHHLAGAARRRAAPDLVPGRPPGLGQLRPQRHPPRPRPAPRCTSPSPSDLARPGLRLHPAPRGPTRGRRPHRCSTSTPTATSPTGSPSGHRAGSTSPSPRRSPPACRSWRPTAPRSCAWPTRATPSSPTTRPANIAFDGKGSILLTNHAFVTGVTNPEQFTVLDVWVADTGSPLEKPIIL